MGTGTQSIDRAAEVLSFVIRAEDPVSFTGVVEATDLARSTAHRVLQALERNGLVERDRDGHFRGGALFATYASRFDRVQLLANAARPSLERVGEETGETVTLGVPSGDSVVHIAQVDTSYVLGATNWLDAEVPTHTSALGKIMYAFDVLALPSGPLERRTPATRTSRDLIVHDLAAVRRDGYAVTSGELEDGLDAVAAPVRWPDGSIHAAIGVSGPAVRIHDQHARIGELLKTEAERLSSVLARHDVTR